MEPVRYRVRHETEYTYTASVLLSRQLLRLKPRDCPWQSCEKHRVRVTPEPAEWVEFDDFFHNHVVQFALQTPHEELRVDVESLVNVIPHASQDDLDFDLPWEAVRNQLQTGTGEPVLDPSQFLFASPHVPVGRDLAAFARASFPPKRPILQGVMHLTHRIFEEFKFDPAATTIATPVTTVLKEKRGVCQDFAHLQIACLRSLGLAARYVSGYILTNPPPGQERLIGADASHAWVSVYCPELGWVDVDPTNDLLVDTQHITVAWGRDFSDVSPLRGVILGGGGGHDLEVRVTVMPLAEEEEAARRAAEKSAQESSAPAQTIIPAYGGESEVSDAEAEAELAAEAEIAKTTEQ